MEPNNESLSNNQNCYHKWNAQTLNPKGLWQTRKSNDQEDQVVLGDAGT